jgi:hypothetical protein
MWEIKVTSISVLSIIFFCILIASCNKPPCECDIPSYPIEIKFVNQQGQNLMFGSFALYRIDSLQISKQYNNNDINNASVSKGLTDSTVVRLDFYVPETKSYIYYNDHTPQDSLEIKWLIKKGKCCGNVEEYKVFDSVKFNAVLIKPINGQYYFVK